MNSKDVPLGYLHEITEPGKDAMHMFSAFPKNPWSHWLERYLGDCEYKCTPLYARSAGETTARHPDGCCKGIVLHSHECSHAQPAPQCLYPDCLTQEPGCVIGCPRRSAVKTSAGETPGELASDFARAATVENDGHGYTVWRIGGRQFVPLDEAQAALASRELQAASTPETAAPIARSKSQLRRFSHMGAKQFTCAFCGSARDIAEALQVNASETDDSCWPSASIDFAERQPSPGEYVLLYFDELPYPVVGDHQAWSYKQGGFKAKRWLPLPKQRSERT